MIALSICVMDRPGLCASRYAWLITSPAFRPLPTPAGTVAGIVQLPPPVPLQVLARHCARAALMPAGLLELGAVTTDRLGFVQPMVSKPFTSMRSVTPVTPTSTPKPLSQVL